MVSISPTTHVLWLWVRRKNTQFSDRGGLDSPSDSRVPTHGATSVPSILHFLETRFYCSILQRLHRPFKVCIGLDEASFPSRWADQYFHCFLYSSSTAGLWSSSHPDLILHFYHIVACTRLRSSGCGELMRISLFLCSLKKHRHSFNKCFPQEQQRSP